MQHEFLANAIACYTFNFFCVLDTAAHYAMHYGSLLNKSFVIVSLVIANTSVRVNPTLLAAECLLNE